MVYLTYRSHILTACAQQLHVHCVNLNFNLKVFINVMLSLETLK